MSSNKTHTILRGIIAGILWVFVWSVEAQFKVIHFEGYFNNIDHRAMIFNSKKTCDSLLLKDYQGKKPDPELLICYIQDYRGLDIMLYDRNGVAVYMDSTGALYSKDNYATEASPFYLNINLYKIINKRRDIVVEVDDSDRDSLVIRAIPLQDYRLGRVNSVGARYISLFYDNFTYPAKGELSPELMKKLRDGIRLDPKDGKVEDKFTLYIPMELVNVPGTFSLYIYDLKGNILRMNTNLSQNKNVVYRKNLMTGTYRYVILFDSGNIEIKKGMIYFKEPPKPE